VSKSVIVSISTGSVCNRLKILMLQEAGLIDRNPKLILADK